MNAVAFEIPSTAFGSRNEVAHGNERDNRLRGFSTRSADGVLQKKARISDPSRSTGDNPTHVPAVLM